MKPSELIRELEVGRFRPAYYFFGSEEYRIKEAEKTLVKMFLGGQSPTTNHTVLSAAKVKISDILTELSIIPMIGERQIFTISDIQTVSPGDADKIVSLLDPPDPNRVVIFTSPPSRTSRKKSKVVTLLSGKTAAVEFGKLTGSMSERKIRFMLGEHDVEIDPDAMQILIELGGGDMGGLIAEVNKLIDYVGEGGRVTRDDIARVSSDYQAFQTFELAEKVASLEIDHALEIMDFLLRKGEKASSLLFWLGEHFIGIYLTKNGKPVRQGNRDQSWKYRKHVNLYENKQLERVIELIAEADRELRSNIKPERLILEKLLINILVENRNKSPNERADWGRKSNF
ncbi:MAG: DNA polymerase III subunit delta [Candidatus Zixiibacteriota bacterium]|nr:MAG: DNA polymerase III subunit delta [candidate division Zixibacteria bacterium]